MSQRLADQLALIQATLDFEQWARNFGEQVVRDDEAYLLPVERDVPIRYVLDECRRADRPLDLITDGPPGTGRHFVGMVGGTPTPPSATWLASQFGLAQALRCTWKKRRLTLVGLI